MRPQSCRHLHVDGSTQPRGSGSWPCGAVSRVNRTGPVPNHDQTVWELSHEAGIAGAFAVSRPDRTGRLRSGRRAGAAAPPQVGTVTAEQQTVPLTRDLVGRLSAYFSANVTARVSGVLLQARLQGRQRGQAGAAAVRDRSGLLPGQLNNDLAALAEDQATYINDRVTAERDHKLLPIGSVSQQTVDDADAAERSAAAKVKADQAAVESRTRQPRLHHGDLADRRHRRPAAGHGGRRRRQQHHRYGLERHPAHHGRADRPALCEFHHQRGRSRDAAAGAERSALAQQNETTVQIVLPNGSPYDQVGTLDFSDVAVNRDHRRGESARRWSRIRSISCCRACT